VRGDVVGVHDGARTDWNNAPKFWYEQVPGKNTFAIHRGAGENHLTLRGDKAGGLLKLLDVKTPWTTSIPASETQEFGTFVIHGSTGDITVKDGNEGRAPLRKWVVYVEPNSKGQLRVALWDGVTPHPNLQFQEVILRAVQA
jgi:hypothetical protein